MISLPPLPLVPRWGNRRAGQPTISAMLCSLGRNLSTAGGRSGFDKTKQNKTKPTSLTIQRKGRGQSGFRGTWPLELPPCLHPLLISMSLPSCPAQMDFLWQREMWPQHTHLSSLHHDRERGWLFLVLFVKNTWKRFVRLELHAHPLCSGSRIL